MIMPNNKVGVELANLIASPRSAERLAVIVFCRDESISGLGGDFGAQRSFPRLRAFAASLAKQEIAKLVKVQAVRAVFFDSKVHHPPILRARASLAYGADLIGAPCAWRKGYTGNAVPICVADTGVDASFPYLQGRIAYQEDFTGEGCPDLDGHGTHVIGTIACNCPEYPGVSPDAPILVVKVLGNDGYGFTSNIMAGIEKAIAKGARVLSLSLGSDEPSDGNDALSRTCEIAANQFDVVCCVANGNAGPRPGSVGIPASAREVLSVGACTRSDSIAGFSSRGPTADGRVKPELVAPGVDIVSCRAKGTSMGHPIDDLWTSASGTSMAAPHAAGAAALLRQRFPKMKQNEIRHILTDACKDLGQTPNAQGRGRIDLRPIFEQAESCGTKPYVATVAPGQEKSRTGCLPGCLGSLFVLALGLIASVLCGLGFLVRWLRR